MKSVRLKTLLHTSQDLDESQATARQIVSIRTPKIANGFAVKARQLYRVQRIVR